MMDEVGGLFLKSCTEAAGLECQGFLFRVWLLRAFSDFGSHSAPMGAEFVLIREMPV
ncbi:hypothetical protein [Lysobacter gummosus]|uniref:hypothetical protein n=1 Tax=Lysobacter gummosus TaxID=262324 RepID=UPI00363F70B6